MPPLQTAGAAEPVPMRKFGDHAATRAAVFDNALAAANTLAPVDNGRYRLSVHDVAYKDVVDHTPDDVKKAILENRTLARRLVGTVRLTDAASGAVAGERKMTLASVPYLTDQGTFLLDGNPTPLSAQLRLDPGIYARRRDNGTVESHVNPLPQSGAAHRLALDPATGVLKVEAGQAEIPAYPLFQALGATHEDVAAALGPQLAEVNRKAAKPHHTAKLLEKLGPRGPVPAGEDAQRAALAQALGGIRFDPWVSKRTLGLPADRYTKEAALAAAAKAVKVFRGEADPDDRDSFAYQTAWGPEHLIAERIARAQAPLKQALWRATTTGSLDRLPPGFLNGPLRALFVTSGLSQNPEGANALEFMDHGARITKVGEGGLGRSADAVPRSAREVHPSQFLFVDPVKSPECFDGVTEVLTARGWVPWAAVRDDDRFACRVDGRVEYHPATRVHRSAFAGRFYGYYSAQGSYLVTPNHRLWVRPVGDPGWRWVTAEEAHGADYFHLTGDPEAPAETPFFAGDQYAVWMGITVYCATVPGGMLYTRNDGRPGFWSGNSEAAGIDLRAAFGTRIGADRRLYAPVRDARSGRIVYRSTRDLADAPLAFPVTYEKAGPADPVPAVVGGKLSFVPKAEVRYVAPSMEQGFSPLSNLVPVKSSIKGQRSSMAGRMISQSLPLVDPEAPLVRAGVPGQPGKSFEELYGRHAGAVFAARDGVVERVDPTRVVVRYADGSRGEHHYVVGNPVGRKSGLDQTPVVKPGDRVAADQLLVRSNYTDARGHAAYGVNARVAYYPFLRHGKATFEDAIGVRRSFADRLSSEHLYRHDFDAQADGLVRGKAAFAAAFPGTHPPGLYKNYDDDGVIKPGTPVDPDHPLVLAVRRRDGTFGVGRTKKAGLSDASLVWDHSAPGVVQDVVRRKDGVTVTVRTRRPMGDADKLAGRHGNKGVVHLIPDDEMPTGEDGKPFDVLLSPLGITSRINPSAVHETWLGKLAAARGTPEVVHDWGADLNNLRDVRAKLAAAGVSPTETVTDPATGRQVPGVLTGVQYMMKLHHMSEDKAKGRGLGAYDETGVPLRGQSGRAGRMSMGDSDALLAHGAANVLADARLYRGQQNQDFWLAYKGGYAPARPAAYRHFDRFLDQLRGGGIDPVRRPGDRLQLLPLAPARVRELAGDREVTKAETVDPNRDDAPVPGGLHDPALFGDASLGLGAERWAKITLPEPYPSPAFEDPARRLLGLTERQYRDVLAGRDKVRGRSGPAGLAQVLREFDVPAELEKARREFAGGRKTAREAAARKLAYLKALDRTGATPADWVAEAVPVIPPSFRPVRRQAQTNALTVHDQNVVYAELLNANKAFRDLHGRVADTGDERLAVYDAVKAAYGLGAPVSPESRAKDVKGVLDQVFGGNRGAKGSVVQQKLLGTPVDLSGRGVILPNPDLHIDEMGVPEEVAWNVYEPFVTRRLTRRGVNGVEAIKRVAARDPMAKKALLEEMAERPVISTRYPVLHKYNTMAFYPRLVPGSAIHLNTLVNKGFNADYNGDSCRTPLLPVLVRNKLFLGDFETFIREYALTGYNEATAVADLGRCTTVLEFRDDADVRVPGVGPDGSVGWKRVGAVSIHTSHGPVCYQVKTARGMDAVFTAHHNFVVLDGECRFTPAKTADVAAGSLLPTVFGLDPSGDGVSAPGRPDLPLDYRAGFFLGHYLGDGSVTGRDDTVSQASFVPELLDYLEECGALFSARRPWREGNGKSSRWTDTDLVAWLSETFGRGYAGKRVPGWAVMAPRAFREGLLVGFVVAEGSRRTGGATAEVANRPLVLAMQMVASTLGISSQVRPGKPPRTSKKTGADLAETFVLWVNQKGLAEKISYWPDVEKVQKFRRMTTRGSHQVWDRVPYPPAVSTRVNAVTKGLRGGRGRWAAKAGRPAATRSGQFVSAADRKAAEAAGVCTRAMARKLIAHYALADRGDPVLDRWVAIVGNERLMWDEVVSVEVTPRPDVTYDFHVPDGETFCIDGFYVTHNTMSVHVPFSDAAVRDAREKMLPSRNLYSTSDFSPRNYLPSMEFLQGLHYATTADAGGHPAVFRTRKEAIEAHKRGKIRADQPVEILDERG